jgi:hypothetical protein
VDVKVEHLAGTFALGRKFVENFCGEGHPVGARHVGIWANFPAERPAGGFLKLLDDFRLFVRPVVDGRVEGSAHPAFGPARSACPKVFYFRWGKPVFVYPGRRDGHGTVSAVFGVKIPSKILHNVSFLQYIKESADLKLADLWKNPDFSFKSGDFAKIM